MYSGMMAPSKQGAKSNCAASIAEYLIRNGTPSAKKKRALATNEGKIDTDLETVSNTDCDQ